MNTLNTDSIHIKHEFFWFLDLCKCISVLLENFFCRRFVVVLVFCQCHDLPFTMPKVLRILRATSRALQHSLEIFLVRWPIEVYSHITFHVIVLVEPLECVSIASKGWDLQRWPLMVLCGFLPLLHFCAVCFTYAYAASSVDVEQSYTAASILLVIYHDLYTTTACSPQNTGAINRHCRPGALRY